MDLFCIDPTDRLVLRNWKRCAQCGCGNITFIPDFVCEACGESAKWKWITVRVVSTAVWWNPATWGNYRVEEKPE